MDRFVSIIDAASGAVAIHCDGRRSHAYTLLTAYLLRRRSFPSAGEAVAWIHMARGAAVPVAVEPALVDALATAARRSRSRAFSVCTEADLAPLTRAADAGRPESAAGSPFPRGPGSPRRGSCARIFSVSSPNIQCDGGGAAGSAEDAAAAGMVDGSDGSEGSCCESSSYVGSSSEDLSAADTRLDAHAETNAADAYGGACAAAAPPISSGGWTGAAVAILRACSSYAA
jgi:hypothetical protein